MIEGYRAGTKKDKTEGQGGESEWEFVAVLAEHSVVEVNFGDGDGKVDADGESGGAGEETDENKDAAEEFGEGRKIGAPAGEAEAGDELNVVVKSAENFMVAMSGHNGAQSKAHNEESKRLQAIEVTQVIFLRRKKRINYSRVISEGKWRE